MTKTTKLETLKIDEMVIVIRGTLMMENLTLSEFQKVKKSKFGWNFNIMDGLGWILKIFKQNHQKRPEAKVNLRNNDQRLEQPPVVQMAWKLCHYGWFGFEGYNYLST